MFQKKKILITGGSGLLALNWAVAIREEYIVYLGLHERTIEVPVAYALTIDMTSVSGFFEILEELRPDIVVHAAGLTDVDRCEMFPEEAGYVNTTLAHHVALGCSKAGTKLIHISTDHLFSGDSAWSGEDDPVAPVNIYGRTKAEAERIVLEACPSALVIRTNFFGWGPSYRQSFSDFVVYELEKGCEITLYDDIFHTPILASTLAAATHQLVIQDVNGVFNVVGNKRVSKYEFGLRIASALGLDTQLIRRGSFTENRKRVNRPRDMSLSNSKLTHLLGNPVPSIEDDISMFIRQRDVLSVLIGK